MPGQELRFEQWANSYVVTSAAAATLLGLLFVAITLAAERGRKDTPSISTYLTPTAIYFSSVLGTSALLTVPNHARITAVVCICIGSIAGLGYSASLAIRHGASIKFYNRSDLLPYVAFPFAGYVLMFAGGLLSLRRPQFALDLVRAGMLVLLAIGIRNSGSIAITIISSHE